MAAQDANPKPLPCSLECLEALAEQHGTPFHMYDEEGMVTGVKKLISAFEGEGFNFTQFFAVKATPNPAVLAALVAAGCGLDCSSTAELYIAHKLGVPGHKIMFTSNYTSKVRGREKSVQKFSRCAQFPHPGAAQEDLAWAVKQNVILNLDG